MPTAMSVHRRVEGYGPLLNQNLQQSCAQGRVICRVFHPVMLWRFIQRNQVIFDKWQWQLSSHHLEKKTVFKPSPQTGAKPKPSIFSIFSTYINSSKSFLSSSDRLDCPSFHCGVLAHLLVRLQGHCSCLALGLVVWPAWTLRPTGPNEVNKRSLLTTITPNGEKF